MADLFSHANTKSSGSNYSAKDIEVLEGLEPVRRRPGMYIGGTDENALHHLVAEVFDNAMDEAVASHATWIELNLSADNFVTVRDNGRGIPVDPHPKFPKKSALEVILTMLHSGGKFSNKVYHTSGGLHGVGLSVVNALSDKLIVEVARDKTLWKQEYSRGVAKTKLQKVSSTPNRRGTTIIFHPDPEIFGNKHRFQPKRLYQLAKSKAYLFKGVEIRWSCDPILLGDNNEIPANEVIHFPGGLKDFLISDLENTPTVIEDIFAGEVDFPDKQGRAEWAIQWPKFEDGFVHSYCNTIPTPQGGTHESGLRSAILKGLKEYGERVNNKKANVITGDDINSGACIILSVFLKDPHFQGQTKEKLVNTNATKLVENAIKDHFDHWLSRNPEISNILLNHIISRAEERISRRQQKDTNRKSIVQKLRLPGKLADCTREVPQGTEVFLVEGDSAGGSAKQARQRDTQAVLPLRGKILNVASATSDKIRGNQELSDMLLALGCGTGANYDEKKLRYEKVVIMTDADVDGAHIASLLMTYFYQEMPELINNGHLYLAQPPLYRLTQGTKTYYARDDKDKERLLKELGKNRQNIDIGRFKGLGEMTAQQLKETTMDPKKRTLLKVVIAEDDRETTSQKVEQLMGKKPEHRFRFIQEQSLNRKDQILENLDI